ncbi:MAG: NAD-dependent dehydratase [Candidatus Pelagibacter sp.]|nr:NAD-dependent dehydratase [Candidatus Pelagibacter sp.]|tara:strand:+ start:391 stop:1398 length:1008 start_codon:yes stop_codon:yes gene_type:complete
MTSPNKKKYLVTGGAGFIGSHLVEYLLKDGNEVCVLDNLSTGRTSNLLEFREDIEFIECDLSKPGIWQSEIRRFSNIFHLAALADIVPSIQNPVKYFQANAAGTVNLLNGIKDFKHTKIIYAASSSCYGIPEKYPTDENEKIDPKYPYALTKRLGEEIVLHWSKVFGVSAISLRLFNVYGPRSRTSGTYGAMFGVFLKQKLANHPFTIVGDGTQTRDFTFVSDVVNAMVTAMKSSIFSGIYNVGSDRTVSVNRIVELLGGEKVFIDKRPGEPDCTFADITKIKKEFNWYPKVPIEKGIEKLLDGISYWEQAPLWTPEKIREATTDWFLYLGKNNE